MSCPLGRCQNPQCPSKAVCLLARANGSKDVAHADQIANRRQNEANQRTIGGVVAGYDAQSQQVLIRLPGGGIVKAESITNGSLPVGQGVQVSNPRMANRGLVDGMPRGT